MNRNWDGVGQWRRAIVGAVLVGVLVLPGIAHAQTAVFDSCDVQMHPGTYVVASNHDGSGQSEVFIAAVCGGLVQQGGTGIPKGTSLSGTNQVCYTTGSSTPIVVASTPDDWQYGVGLCQSLSATYPALTPPATAAGAAAATAQDDALRAKLDASLTQLSAIGQGGASQSQPAVVSPPVVSVASGGVVDDHIDGEFDGWSSNTVFFLQNGQAWQQTDSNYLYMYEYSPRVLIFPSSGGWRMQVQGVQGTVAVQRIR